MSERSESNLLELLRGWRRANLWDASQNFLRMFAFANLAVVLLTWAFAESVNFGLAFVIGLAAALIFAVASMIFKIMPVFEQ